MVIFAQNLNLQKYWRRQTSTPELLPTRLIDLIGICQNTDVGIK